MHCTNRTYRIVLTAILMVLVSITMQAQELSDARNAYEQGHYENAVLYYKTIIEDYKDNNWSTNLLEAEKEKALNCLLLLTEADEYKSNKRYTSAIEKYRQIININPADPIVKAKIKECERLNADYAARQAEEKDWRNCKTIADYEQFIRRYPNSKYNSPAQQKINELKSKDDDERWEKAKAKNKIEYYEAYISAKTSYSKHVYEAKQKLYILYIDRASYYFGNNDYSSAKKYYEKAKDINSLREISLTKYNKCCEEIEFQRIEKSSYRFITDLDAFLTKYPTSSHASIVRGWMVEKEMSRGNFDAARDIVNKYVVAFSDTNTPDTKWWLKHIKAREKEYKKSHKSAGKTQAHTNSTAKRSNTASHKPRTPILVKIPISLGIFPSSPQYNRTMNATSSERTCIARMGIGLSFGSYSDLFNLEIGATALMGGKVSTGYVVSVAPTFNVVQYDDYGYHVNVQPYYGWHNVAGSMFGLRAGTGWHFFDVSAGATYGSGTGFLFDVTFKMNIHLFRF